MVQVLTNILTQLLALEREAKIKSAEIMRQLIERVTEDEVISRVIYMFDYNQIWCNSFPIQDKKLEREVDQTLHFLSYIVYLHNEKLMDDEVFGCVEYLIMRSVRNESTRKYLQFINDFAKTNNVQCPFKLLIDYGIAKGVLSKDVFNK